MLIIRQVAWETNIVLELSAAERPKSLESRGAEVYKPVEARATESAGVLFGCSLPYGAAEGRLVLESGGSKCHRSFERRLIEARASLKFRR
ncbi:hypothetical protein D3C80_1672760 [compost metagenome]